MRAIDTKVLRDIARMRGQLLAISLVIASGVGLFLGMRTTMHSLDTARADYYARERFADVFASLKRAPEHVAERLRQIPGVERVQTRVVAEVVLDIPGMIEAATGRLVSLPDKGRPEVNGVRLRSGRWPAPGRGEEIVVSEPFAEAHEFPPGTTIHAIINGSREQLKIVGTALAPEFIFVTPPGVLFPDDSRFGVMWMRRDALGPAYDMEGAFNDACLQLAQDAQVDQVIQRVDTELERFGGIGAIPRKEQQSAFFVDNELVQLRTFGLMIPSLFLAVATFLLNIVISRLISTQREQIAALKALGYRDREVGLHYARLIGLVWLAGLLVGVLLAAWIGSGLTRLYVSVYRFPELPYLMRGSDVLIVAAISLVAAGLGTWGAILRTVRLPPAEAMRPEAPPTYRRTLLERVGLTRLVPTAARIVLRELERKPGRAALSVFGIAMALALMIVSSFSYDAVSWMMAVQFRLNQREDVQLTLYAPRANSVLTELEHLPGVTAAEPYRAVPVRFRSEHRQHLGTIIGVQKGATLQRVLDVDLRRVEMPPQGLVLPQRLAQKLRVTVGDVLTIEVREGDRPIHRLPVARIAQTYIGMTAYLELSAMCDMLKTTPSFNGAWLLTDDAELVRLHAAVKETPVIAGVSSRANIERSAKQILDENLGGSLFINLAFSLIMAFGVLYNAARITLAERARELASLRVLGFRRSEVGAILLGQIGLLTTIAIPLGLWFGRELAAGMAASSGFNTEQFRLPLIIHTRTYALGVLVVLVAAAVSGWAAWRKLDRMNIIEVLKTRD